MDQSERDRLTGLVDRLAGVRVLVVGDAMLDRYVRGTIDRISPEAPVPIFLAHEEFDRLGGAANVAANIASLGGTGHLVALVGRAHSPNGQEGADSDDNPFALPDPVFPVFHEPAPAPKTPKEFSARADWAAARLALKCAGQDFTPHLLPFLNGTIVKTRLLAGLQQVIRIDQEGGSSPLQSALGAAVDAPPGVTAVLDAQGRLARARTLEPLLAQVDAILVSDYAKGMVDAELFEQLLASGKPMVVDPRPSNRALYRGATLTTPNRREAMEMLGLDHRVRIPAGELAQRLCHLLDIDVLLTLGDEGMLLAMRDGRQTALPARAREVFDVTGAGDTVAAVMGLGVGAGLELVDAARLANAAAGVVVGHLGTAVSEPSALKAALRADDCACG